MTPEEVEATIIGNSQAIAVLTEIAKNTSKDVDKVVNHMDKAIVMLEKISSLERRVGVLEGWKGKVTWVLLTYLIGLVAYLLAGKLGL